MGANSKIEWTHHTFNPWRGCQHAKLADGSDHPGCRNCYAERDARRFPAKLGQWGANGTRIVAPDGLWREPLLWNKKAKAAGERQRVFCSSIADVFERWRGPMLDNQGKQVVIARFANSDPGDSSHWLPLTMSRLRRRLFGLIDATPWLDWLLVTKRPGNVRRMWFPIYDRDRVAENVIANRHQDFRRNVWLITSVSDQPTAEELVPKLLNCHGLVPVLGLSVEPLVADIEFHPDWFSEWDHRPSWPYWQTWQRMQGIKPDGKSRLVRQGIDWVIVGGESGRSARPCSVEWMRSIVAQCEQASCPVFVKQCGSNPYVPSSASEPEDYPALSAPKGGDPAEWPTDLRVREFPEVQHA